MTNKIIDYKILASNSNQIHLQTEVMKFLGNGYELYGYPFWVDGAIMQAVIKYRREEV